MAEDSKLDRELIELLNELRVVLPGVQVLFAFLLTVPFSNRFDTLTKLQTNAYFAAFLFTTVASILLITPSAYHRLRWRQKDKEHILVFSNRVAIAGLCFLAVSIALVVFVVSDVLFDARAAGIAGGIAAAATLAFWFLIPLLRAAEEE
ncbi:MAG: DUF6328 family protein [Actinomycetota bacterium]